MSAPPEASETEGPICKMCGKPRNKHSFQEQVKCDKEEKENGLWHKENQDMKWVEENQD